MSPPGASAMADAAMATNAGGDRHHGIAFALMIAFFALAPTFIYPVFLMKVMCFALFACAFNLLIGYVGLLEGLTKVFYPEASNTVIFIVMAIVLMIKPTGLSGARR